VREILARYPHLGEIFARHGLGGCGGAGGPAERIDFFAAMHSVDVAGLLAELNQAADRGPTAGAATAAAPPDLLYRRFIVAALICTLTLGATFGAYNLACIQLALGPIPPPHNWAHASFQILGFVLLFIMGVGYHVVPRFLATALAGRGFARASFWLVLTGIVLRLYGQFGALLPATEQAYFLGATSIVCGALAFAGVLAATWRRARPAFETFHAFLAAGTFFWVVAAALTAAPPARHEAFYQSALFGGALFWIQGMLLRIGRGFLGLQPPRAWAVSVAFGLQVLGVALALAGRTAAPLSTALGVVAFAVGARLLERRVHEQDPVFARIVAIAVGCSLLFAILAATWSGLALAGGPPPGLLWDGARHAFALGFVTLMIFAVAGRVLPIFGGTDLAWPRLRAAGAWLIALAVVGREMEVVAALGKAPALLILSGVSGAIAAAGVALCSISLLATLRRSGRPAAEQPTAMAAIDADANVAALVSAHPELLAVLVGAGFTPLANPIARRTIARAITLRTASQLHGIEVEQLLERLRAACTHRPPRDDAPGLIPLSRLSLSSRTRSARPAGGPASPAD